MPVQDSHPSGNASGLLDQEFKLPTRIRLTTSVVSRIERVFPIRIDTPTRKSPIVLFLANSDVDNHGSLQSTALAPPASPRLEAIRSSMDVAATAPSHICSAEPMGSTANFSELVSVSGDRPVTNRLAFLPGDPTGKLSDGEKIYRCEDEPIRIPGAIQRFGALVAIRENECGDFLVRLASENSHSVTGLEPDALFELRSFIDVLPQNERQNFITRVRYVQGNVSGTNPDVFAMSLTSLLGAPRSLFCAMHLNRESDLVICEFEVDQGVFSPFHLPNEGLPDEPMNIMDHQVIGSERLLSTTSRSMPLQSLKVARKALRHLGSIDLLQILFEMQAQLTSAATLPDLLDTIVGLVYELTCFHRVMVYQFDETAAGSVISEIVDPRASSDTYRGLHFPASDIPQQARELYMINTIRILYDTEQETARLVCRTFGDAKTPLDLKHSYLRAMSPIHIKYLGNMGVRASMSISLIVGGKLWGLISCHNYGSGLRVSLPVRELCRGLGGIASTNIEKLIYSSRTRARNTLEKAPEKALPSAYVAASSSELLSMFGADFAFLAIKGEARTIGKLIAYDEAVILLQYIRQRAFSSIYSSNAIGVDFLDINYPPGFSVISGVLVIPFAISGADFLVFFRKGRLKEVNWAGNPREKNADPGTSYLQPRSSFKIWSENVIGTSREWTEHEVESAAVLSSLYGRFIDVWRQKDAIVQKNRMTRLLIRNVGHEARTPLNSIINYLEVALEESLDNEARQHLQRSLQASKSLVFVVNDLLNLTEVEDADFSIHMENVDLRAMITDVIAAFKDESSKRDIDIVLELNMAPPWLTRCDPSGLRQVVANLLANAIKNSEGGTVRIRVDQVSIDEVNLGLELTFEDEGRGLSEQQLDNIFQDFEQIMDEDDKSSSSIVEGRVPSEAQARGIGLGLAITARFVRLNNGQISMSSEGKDKGTRVCVKLSFRKALVVGSPKLKLSLDVPLTLPMEPHFLFPQSLPESIATPSTEFGGSEESSFASEIPSPLSPKSKLVFFDTDTNSTRRDSGISRFPFPTISSEHKLNILVAEDNPLNSRLLETRLKRRGHEVRVVVDGQACVDAFKASPAAFDIILMDIQMPIIDGIEATRLIRETEKVGSLTVSEPVASYGRIPIVATSASLREQYRLEYLDIGFDAWILKPIDFKRLEDIIVSVHDQQLRAGLLYASESWDNGGWFRLDGKEIGV